MGSSNYHSEYDVQGEQKRKEILPNLKFTKKQKELYKDLYHGKRKSVRYGDAIIVGPKTKKKKK